MNELLYEHEAKYINNRIFYVAGQRWRSYKLYIDGIGSTKSKNWLIEPDRRKDEFVKSIWYCL